MIDEFKITGRTRAPLVHHGTADASGNVFLDCKATNPYSSSEPHPTKEGGYIESLDRHVTPRSLYLTQLRERLEDAAVRNIAGPSQI